MVTSTNSILCLSESVLVAYELHVKYFCDEWSIIFCAEAECYHVCRLWKINNNFKPMSVPKILPRYSSPKNDFFPKPTRFKVTHWRVLWPTFYIKYQLISVNNRAKHIIAKHNLFQVSPFFLSLLIDHGQGHGNEKKYIFRKHIILTSSAAFHPYQKNGFIEFLCLWHYLVPQT